MIVYMLECHVFSYIAFSLSLWLYWVFWLSWLSLVAVPGLLIAVAPLFAEHRLQGSSAPGVLVPRLWGTGALLLCPTWHLPEPGTEPVSTVYCIRRWILYH